MPAARSTVDGIVAASSWDQRVAKIRLVVQNHAPAELSGIYADIARQVYVPHLAPDFAYIHELSFYGRAHFSEVYDSLEGATQGFTRVDEADLLLAVQDDPRRLLVLRTILGLTKDEFAHSAALVADSMEIHRVSSSKIGGCEQSGTALSHDQALVLARTITAIMDGSLFGEPPVDDVETKQRRKIDTRWGWESVEGMHRNGVPYKDLLHQRHYGGAFRQITDATSTRRGNILEEAVAELFDSNGVSYIRTGSHEQHEIEERFEIIVRPAPDFVVYDESGALRAMLECKLVSDGGTARDKALRFERLREESRRLGGIPLLAVLGGMGWARVNDTLGPVVRDTDGRVFTISTLVDMLTVAPFPTLIRQH